MIDLHCHILPNLDDGPHTIEESVAMVRLAWKDGIRMIVASSHITPGIYDNSPLRIVETTDKLNERLKEEKIPVRIVPGADNRIFPEMIENPESFLRINTVSPYFLLEFPHDMVPPGSGNLAESLLNEGLIPVITHPERNRELQIKPEKLGPFVKMGCLVQVTAMSLTGDFGWFARDTSEYFMKEGLVHVIATDAHDTRKRPPVLSRGLKQAAEWVGEEAAGRMVLETPEMIVNSISGEQEAASGKRET
ncbi:MAG TPA: CpsB/CapC family capsule biosynthesis tyrosine phosphatase [Nitrospiria bacterium]